MEIHKIGILLAMLCAGLILSCLPKRTYGEGKDCKVYYKYVSEAWEQKPDGYFALTKPAIYDEELPEGRRFINKPCLIGLSEKHIIKLFGKPSRKVDNRFEYFMNERCERENYYGCYRLKIFFDQHGFVDSIPSSIRIEIPPTY